MLFFTELLKFEIFFKILRNIFIHTIPEALTVFFENNIFYNFYDWKEMSDNRKLKLFSLYLVVFYIYFVCNIDEDLLTFLKIFTTFDLSYFYLLTKIYYKLIL